MPTLEINGNVNNKVGDRINPLMTFLEKHDARMAPVVVMSIIPFIDIAIKGEFPFNRPGALFLSAETVTKAIFLATGKSVTAVKFVSVKDVPQMENPRQLVADKTFWHDIAEHLEEDMVESIKQRGLPEEFRTDLRIILRHVLDDGLGVCLRATPYLSSEDSEQDKKFQALRDDLRAILRRVIFYDVVFFITNNEHIADLSLVVAIIEKAIPLGFSRDEPGTFLVLTA